MIKLIRKSEISLKTFYDKGKLFSGFFMKKKK